MKNHRSLLVVGLAALVLSVSPFAVVAEEHAGDEAKEHKEHAGDEAKDHKEHAGDEAKEHKEHAGDEAKEHKEHAGDEAKDHKEHAGDEANNQDTGLPANSRAMMKSKTDFYASEIKTAITSHINKKIAADGGIFKIRDPQENNKLLNLKFVKIHDPVRKIKGKGYFACSDFSIAGDTQGKLYDLDFWLSPQNGRLGVTETKIHKEPALEQGAWVKKARYTFINDKPVVVQ